MKQLTIMLMLIIVTAVAAQAQCDQTTLNGPYAYSARGFFVNGPFGGGLHIFSGAGKMTFDGQGNVMVKDTESVDGSVTRGQSFSGVYTMSGDCTGTITLNSPASGRTSYDFAVKGTSDLTFVGASDSANTTGTATKQAVATVQ